MIRTFGSLGRSSWTLLLKAVVPKATGRQAIVVEPTKKTQAFTCRGSNRARAQAQQVWRPTSLSLSHKELGRGHDSVSRVLTQGVLP